jgi:DNA transformation protein
VPSRSAANSQSRTSAPSAHLAQELARAINLGPKSASVLVRAGIISLAEVERLGAVKVYSLAKRAEPTVTLNLLWALEGAVIGQPWQVVAKEHRASLLIALEDYERHLAAL